MRAGHTQGPTFQRTVIQASGHGLTNAYDIPLYHRRAKARLLYPTWLEKFGGSGADATRASLSVWQNVGHAGLPRSTASMVSHIRQHYGKPELQDDVLPRFEMSACLERRLGLPRSWA